MKVDLEKVGIIASYFSENIPDLYVTKLLKLFYYLDFISYKMRGSSVTNDVYFKLPYGPVPTAIKNEIDILYDDNVLGPEYKSYLSNYIGLETDLKKNGKIVYSKKSRVSDLKKLATFESELMKEIATAFKGMRAGTISNQTHKEKPWLLTSDCSPISYELAEGLNVEKILPNFQFLG